jgi:hypothetical protein
MRKAQSKVLQNETILKNKKEKYMYYISVEVSEVEEMRLVKHSF